MNRLAFERTKIDNLDNKISKFTCGADHLCILTANNALYTCGYNF